MNIKNSKKQKSHENSEKLYYIFVLELHFLVFHLLFVEFEKRKIIISSFFVKSRKFIELISFQSYHENKIQLNEIEKNIFDL
ncbi:hypothetical protein TRFO_33716 [Tritrichomonas foetus]|uniref:Uncharacterized protein n=1 Tax=Tritrichomonas foetus TaxID=1144522 RepID=A0A1J4JMY2_9EUKA|nr:hypothetical protein TRFO_33716 [Tritrichomonas foetus]|eukprot:OHS99791.1 hypothetical protein TRFO_33716 [Tritrichomonas foetus]